MASQTVAMGLVVGLKDMASKGLDKLIGRTAGLSRRMDRAGEAGSEMTDAFGKGKSTFTELKDVIGELGLVLKIVTGPIGFIIRSFGKFAAFHTQLAENRVLLGQTAEEAKDLGDKMLLLSTDTGIPTESLVKLNRTMGGLSETESTLAEATTEAAKMMAAFKMDPKDATTFARLGTAMGGTSDSLNDLGTDVLQFQRVFRLDSLMGEVPGIMVQARSASLRLGTDFQKKLTPQIAGVSKVTAILAGKLKMTQEESAATGKRLLGDFQGMAFGMQEVFTGVSDEFDSKTQSLLESFVRSGKGAEGAFSAIGKAAEGNFTDIAQSFMDTQKQGGMAAKRMRVLFMKEFGDELPTILENLEKTDKALADDFKKTVPEGIKKTATLRGAQEKLLMTADNLVKRFSELGDNFVKALGLGQHFGDGISKLFDKVVGFGKEVQIFWNKLVKDTDGSMGAIFSKFTDTHLVPFMKDMQEKLGVMLGDLNKRIKKWLFEEAAPWLDRFLNDHVGPMIHKASIWIQKMWYEFGGGVDIIKDVIGWFQEWIFKFDVAIKGIKFAIAKLAEWVASVPGIKHIIAWKAGVSTEDLEKGFAESSADYEKEMRDADAKLVGVQIEREKRAMEREKRRKEIEQMEKAGTEFKPFKQIIKVVGETSTSKVDLGGQVNFVTQLKAVDQSGGTLSFAV